VILFEMLTGELPFPSPDPTQLAELHLNAPPPAPRALNPEVPPALELIVLKLLSKEPTARYRTADQLARILRTFQQTLMPPQTPAMDQPTLEATELPTATSPAIPALAPLSEVDWLAVLLGLVAFVAVTGLIPLWLYACLLYPQCPIR
jgi:serine/threonine-protein kinase